MTKHKDREHDLPDDNQRRTGRDLLPEADAGKTDAAKYSTDEGRTEEDLEP